MNNLSIDSNVSINLKETTQNKKAKRTKKTKRAKKQIIEMNFIIDDDGDTTTCVYTEDIDLSLFGKIKATRASHVEPTDDGGWEIDFSPSRGPKVGGFRTRGEAIDFEVKILQELLSKGQIFFDDEPTESIISK